MVVLDVLDVVCVWVMLDVFMWVVVRCVRCCLCLVVLEVCVWVGIRDCL